MAKPRDYAEEYQKYHKTKKQKADHYARTKARRMLVAEGVIEKHAPVDVDHIKALKTGGTTTRSNLRVRSRKANRGDKTF